jgi:DUF1365 family protein
VVSSGLLDGTPAGPSYGAAVVTPARYDLWIRHQRHDPVEYGFARRGSTWLIDLDAVPRLPRGLGRLCRFSLADHRLTEGPPASSLRAEVDRFLAGHGVRRPATVRMLASPRVLGYVFNPLTVFYCYDSDGVLRHAVAEVRNTYGGRHSYLLQPDPAGRAVVDKQFYVSPFYPVDGRYTMRLPEPGVELTVAVTLYREHDRPFSAVLTGRRVGHRPAGLWAALRTPLATRAVIYGIRRHGIALYLKGLRPVPRPSGSIRPESADRPHTERERLHEHQHAGH